MRTRFPGCAALLLTVLLLAVSAQGHQELLFARVSSEPPVPVAGEAFDLLVRLTESSGQPITDVDLVAALSESKLSESNEAEGDEIPGPDDISDGVELRPGAVAGTYRGRMGARPEGVYRLTLVEVVEGRTEASGSGLIEVGGDGPLQEELLLPPSGRSALGSWLVWLVGLPLLAGLLVTLLVFTGRRGNEEER